MPDARYAEFRARRDKSTPVLPDKIGVIRNGGSQAEDTAAGCAALAASALARASTMDTRNGQLRLEHSAGKWLERAALLQSLETSSVTRQALDKAEWEQADADELEYHVDPDTDQAGDNESESPNALPSKGGRL